MAARKVQDIADSAAEEIAAGSDVEEDVEVTVNETPTVDPNADDDGTVWMRGTNGAEHHVEVGSPAHERLVDDGAVSIEAPSE